MRWSVFLIAAGLAFAQEGTGTKPKPEDYPVHARAGGVAIGAEFMVHSFSSGEQTFIAPDYLVVEVALFPPKGGTSTSTPGDSRCASTARSRRCCRRPPAWWRRR